MPAFLTHIFQVPHVAFALALIVMLPLSIHLVTILMAVGRRRPQTKPPATRPFVSLIRPVCGLDRFDPDTLASSFHQDYPDYEVIFCAASESDPAVELTRALAFSHPEIPSRVLIGNTPISGNPKLNNLVKGVEAARGEVLVMADANLMLTPDYLATIDDAWAPGVGLVSGPAYGNRAENFWGALECAFLNGNQARWQLAADALGLGFAQGKTLAFRPAVLETGGGLAALGRDLAEDVASTKLVRAQGLTVRLPARLFAQPVGHRSARAVWARQLRWSQLRRDGFPQIFALEVLQGIVPPLVALTALVILGAAPLWSLAALVTLWYGSEALLAAALGWPVGARDLLAMMLRDVLLPALWLATFRKTAISWRGNSVAQGGV